VVVPDSALDVMATGMVISTTGALVFKRGPDGNKLLKASAAGEWRTVELIKRPHR